MTLLPASAQERSSKKSRILKMIITVLAVAGLIWLLDHIGWQVVKDHIFRLGCKGVLILLALGFAECMFDSAALRTATREKISLLRVFSFNQAGSFVNTFIPWEAGEVLKSGLLYRHMSPESAISGTVVWNYVFKLSKPAAAFSAAGIGWTFALEQSESLALLMMLASLCAFLPYVAWRFILYLGPASLIVRLLNRLHIMSNSDPRTLLESARDVDSTVSSYWKKYPASYIRIFLFQYIARVVSWTTLYFALIYLDPQGSYSLAFCGMLYAGFSVMSYLVLLLPTRLGTTEGAGYLLFMLMGLDPALGLITQLVLRLKAIATFIVPAAFVLFDRKTRE